jgi:hypothetical protein
MGTARRGWRRHEVAVRVQTYTPKHASAPLSFLVAANHAPPSSMASRRRLRLPVTASEYHCGCPLQIENSISLAAGGASALKGLSPVPRMPGVGPIADASATNGRHRPRVCENSLVSFSPRHFGHVRELARDFSNSSRLLEHVRGRQFSLFTRPRPGTDNFGFYLPDAQHR